MPATKISENASNILNCNFSNQIYTLAHQTCRKLNLLLVNSTYLIVSAPLKQGRLIQTRVHFKFCYSVRIETTHKPSKLFSSVHVIDATWFDECFLFDVVNRRHYFWQKFVVTKRFFQPPYCFFLWNKCIERSPYISTVQC